MAKIDVEIFTNEIEKTYTILKQNLIMIDTIKELIAQGNLSEDTIAHLKTSIERANAMMDGLETAIDNTNATIENMNKVIPTDINSDNNGYLILEHDGVEITGQKKVVNILKNTDLYVHYLEFSVDESTFYGVVYSSNGNVTNTLQKLTILLKPTSSAQMFIPITYDGNDSAVLYWNGSTWQAAYSGGVLNITSVSDIVKNI